VAALAPGAVGWRWIRLAGRFKASWLGPGNQQYETYDTDDWRAELRMAQDCHLDDIRIVDNQTGEPVDFSTYWTGEYENAPGSPHLPYRPAADRPGQDHASSS
jgi:hypothetical protein